MLEAKVKMLEATVMLQTWKCTVQHNGVLIISHHKLYSYTLPTSVMFRIMINFRDIN